MNYQNTKIYKIMSHLGDKIYIGSTTKKTLAMRMAHHRSGYKQWKNNEIRKVMSFELFEEYGIENCIILLIEAFPCSSKDESNAREAHWIRTLDCVNKIVPGRTNKEYYEDNKEKIDEYSKKYRQQHRELYSNATKKYYENNKEKVDAYRREEIKCDCGGHYWRKGKARHERTKNHQSHIKNN